MGPIIKATSKDQVTHVNSTDTEAKRDTPPPIAWIVFPRYEQGAATHLNPRSKAESFLEIAKNAFGYSLHRQQGFEIIRRTITGADHYHLSYSNLKTNVEARSTIPATH